MKTPVTIELNQKQEFILIERYGRKCSRETLVKRAVQEILDLQSPPVKKEKVSDTPLLDLAESVGSANA